MIKNFNESKIIFIHNPSISTYHHNGCISTHITLKKLPCLSLHQSCTAWCTALEPSSFLSTVHQAVGDDVAVPLEYAQHCNMLLLWHVGCWCQHVYWPLAICPEVPVLWIMSALIIQGHFFLTLDVDEVMKTMKWHLLPKGLGWFHLVLHQVCQRTVQNKKRVRIEWSHIKAVTAWTFAIRQYWLFRTAISPVTKILSCYMQSIWN